MHDLEILYQDTGRFDRRFPVGPARWPHFDLLWVYEGAVQLKIGIHEARVELHAPMGVLICPDVPFSGRALGEFARASVTHFLGGPFANPKNTDYLLPDQRNGFHIQNLLNLAFDYKSRGVESAVQGRLLRAILDCFAETTGHRTGEAARLDQAWEYASARLADIRSLSDVSSGIGLSESNFRALHRRYHSASAGWHLREMRLSRAEQLLTTTGLSVKEIALTVGYAHPESFSAAFLRSKSRAPGAYRRWCRRLA